MCTGRQEICHPVWKPHTFQKCMYCIHVVKASVSHESNPSQIVSLYYTSILQGCPSCPGTSRAEPGEVGGANSGRPSTSYTYLSQNQPDFGIASALAQIHYNFGSRLVGFCQKSLPYFLKVSGGFQRPGQEFSNSNLRFKV